MEKRQKPAPKVSIIMGSKSDWPTMEIASLTLNEFGVEHETRIVSAHRTPDLLFEYFGEIIKSLQASLKTI